MKNLLFVSALILTTSLGAHAESESIRATRESLVDSIVETFDNELDVAPLLAYGSSSGLELGMTLTYSRLVKDHLQANIGGFIEGNNQNQNAGASLGLDYNFSEQLRSSYFVGVATGYGSTVYQNPQGWLGVRFGKRFYFRNHPNLNYKPSLGISESADGSVAVNVMILNFSYLF